jgi:HEAT repeat protein
VSDPIIINGVEVGPSTDVTSLLRSEFRGGSRLAGRYDEGPEPGIRTLIDAAKGTPLEKRLLEGLRSLLTDDDQKVRSGAAGMVLHFAERFDPSELLAVLEKNPQLFKDVAVNQDPELDLAWTLLRAAAASPTRDPRVVERLREAVKDPARGIWVLAGVVSHDPDWVIEHAQEVLRDQPARARIVLYRLKEPEQRERLIRAIPHESPQLRQAMVAAVVEEIKDPIENRRLLSLLQ